jgi:hypothetical protein
LVISEWEFDPAILTKKAAAVRPFTNFLESILGRHYASSRDRRALAM